ncbi:cytosine permease, partial [Erwinia amylovora]|nr:cytosine permease [Erwinia amylovora]
ISAGDFIVIGMAIMIARSLQSAAVVRIMSQAAGGTGLLVFILSTLRVNDMNLYSSSLGEINAVEGIIGKKMQYQ